MPKEQILPQIKAQKKSTAPPPPVMPEQKISSAAPPGLMPPVLRSLFRYTVPKLLFLLADNAWYGLSSTPLYAKNYARVYLAILPNT